MTKLLLPGSTIGIIGGGQLGQMMAMSAKELGFKVGVLDPTEDCPASQVSDWSIKASYDDDKALEKLAQQSDVITYEFENVNAASLEKIQEIVPLPQGLELLKMSQNRKNEKLFLSQLGLPVSPFKIVNHLSEVSKAIEEINYPAVLKTCTGGYDGKGQVVLKSQDDLEHISELLESGECVLESWVNFKKEISVIVSGSQENDYQVFPIAENKHYNNILQLSTIPAVISESCQKEAEKLALMIARELAFCGTMTVEMFVTPSDELIINEIAPRPHNSGHYSIEACNLSQFDTHIRGILSWPIPEIYLHKPAAMLNLLGNEMKIAETLIFEKPDWYFHFYGKKEIKKDRKMGHITILSNSLKSTIEEIQHTKIWE